MNVEEDDGENEGAPQISLQEMLDDLKIEDEPMEADATPIDE
jgi:hypothetical protein